MSSTTTTTPSTSPPPLTFTNKTTSFQTLCKLIPPGQVLQTPNHDPGKAITAVELFSTKMDAATKSTHSFRQPQEYSTEEIQIQFIQPLLQSPTLQCLFIDYLQYFECEFYRGSSLAESVMTCIPAHACIITHFKESLPEIYALVCSIVGICNGMFNTAQQAASLSEEDFYWNNSDIPLHILSHENLLELLKSAIGKYQLQPQQQQQQKSKSKQTNSVTTTPSPSPLSHRLSFRLHLLQALHSMEQFDFPSAKQFLIQAQEILTNSITITDTTNITSQEQQTINTFFNSSLNYWRLVPQPPRRVLPVSVEWTLFKSKFQTTIQGLLEICDVHTLASNTSEEKKKSGSTLLALYENLIAFGNNVVIVERDALVRCRLTCALLDSSERAFGVINWKRLVHRDISTFGDEALNALLSDSIQGKLIEAQIIAQVFETFRTLCANPARSRRRLVHQLEDWGTLEQRCEMLEYEYLFHVSFNNIDFRQRQIIRQEQYLPLSAWATSWCTRLMALYVESGADLDLYSGREVLQLTYYNNQLYRTMMHLNQISNVKTGLLDPKNEKISREQLKSKLTAGMNRILVAQDIRRLLMDGLLLLILSTKEAYDQHYPLPILQSPKLLWDHRFYDPFSTIWLPNTTNYEQFQATIQDALKINRVEMLKRCQVIFESLKSICSTSLKDNDLLRGGNATSTTTQYWIDFYKQTLRCVIRNLLTTTILIDGYSKKNNSTNGGPMMSTYKIDIPQRFGVGLSTLTVELEKE
jgi:hypothetical protein